MKKTGFLLLLPLFSQCAPDKAAVDPGISLDAYHLAGPAKNLSGATVPVMRSPKLDREWGVPEIKILPGGGYSLRYANPRHHFESLTVIGSPRVIDSDAAEPPDFTDIGWDSKKKDVTLVRYPQKWSTVTLFDRPLHYYLLNSGDGADAPEWSTVSFSLTRPGFPAASYRIISSSNKEDGKAVIEGYMRTLRF